MTSVEQKIELASQFILDGAPGEFHEVCLALAVDICGCGCGELMHTLP